MPDLSLNLNARDVRDIEKIGREIAAQLGVSPVPLEDMALELLRGHLVLIRDCPEILPPPDSRPKRRPSAAGTITGLGGVTLRDGVNG
jgi:hypothetical protein